MCEYNNTGRAGMSFYRKYELERLVQKAEPKTFRARDLAGGQPVFLHLLAGMDTVSRTSLLQRARGLAAAGNPAILEVDDSDFAPYVVTGVLENFEGLPAWLDRVSAASRLPPEERETAIMASPIVAARAPQAPTAEPAQPALPARAAAASPKQPVPAPPASQPAPAAFPAPAAGPARAAAPVPTPAPAPAIEPGEFTRMFSGSKGQEMPPAQSPAPAAAPGASEFSQLFGRGPASPPPPSPGGAEPGEFSRLFGAPPAAPADNPAGFAPPPVVKQRPPEVPLPWEPQPAAPPQPVVPSRPVVETPDTQQGMQVYAAQPAREQPPSMWSTPLPPATQQRPDTTEPGEFTRFFASPLASSSLPIEDIEQGRIPEAKAPADRPFEGPGEFTRWFGKSVPGDKTPAPSPPAQFPTFGGQATGVFEAPQVRGPQGTPTPGERKGPSEYTGIMAAPRVEEPAAYVPGAKPGKGPLIVVIIVCVVVLVLLGVVIILSMRR